VTVPTDPVVQRRQRLARLARDGRRAGYGLYGVSLAAFFVGVVTDFTTTPATIAAVTLVIGSVLLLPAIIIGYGVRAADRADRENDW